MKDYKLEPYEEILSEWYRLNKQVIWMAKGAVLYILIFLVSLTAFVFGWCELPKPNILITISAFFMLVAWIYSMWQYCRISNIESKRYREIEDAITPELERMAREWYGKDWHKALRECIEAHFPGDCPLCGAS